MSLSVLKQFFLVNTVVSVLCFVALINVVCISDESCNRSALLYVTCYQGEEDGDNVTVVGINSAFFETVSTKFSLAQLT